MYHTTSKDKLQRQPEQYKHFFRPRASQNLSKCAYVGDKLFRTSLDCEDFLLGVLLPPSWPYSHFQVGQQKKFFYSFSSEFSLAFLQTNAAEVKRTGTEVPPLHCDMRDIYNLV